MIHLLAEAAEMRRDEEVAMQAGQLADRPRFQEAPDAAHHRMVAAVLDHGVEPAGSPSRGDDLLGMGERVGHRLFGEEMTAAAEDRHRQVATRGGDDNVEHDVRLGAVDDVAGVRPDDGVDETEFLRLRARAANIEVNQADDREAVHLPRRLEPGTTHLSATDEHCSQQATFLPHVRVSRGTLRNFRRLNLRKRLR